MHDFFLVVYIICDSTDCYLTEKVSLSKYRNFCCILINDNRVYRPCCYCDIRNYLVYSPRCCNLHVWVDLSNPAPQSHDLCFVTCTTHLRYEIRARARTSAWNSNFQPPICEGGFTSEGKILD